MKWWQKLIIVLASALLLAMGYVAGRLFNPCPTLSDIAAIADSVAHTKIDSLGPSLVRDMKDWDIMHSQIQFHATLFRRRYTSSSEWHRYVRQTLKEQREYWDLPKEEP